MTLFNFKAAACIVASSLFLTIGCNNETNTNVSLGSDPHRESKKSELETQPVSINEETNSEMIQVAILLDTSNSMDGLIDQAKNQLWDVVNKVTSAKNSDGSIPNVRVALYQYGNDGLSMRDYYIQKVTDFTGELDMISKELFSLTTNGGEEYCGAVINHSIDQLEWSNNNESLKMVFIAGNEPFSQGPISFQQTCEKATDQNIVVNTIFCGSYDEGVNTDWAKGALITGGEYFNINSDAIAVHYDTPYDDAIIEMNGDFNGTYLYYGADGAAKCQMQSNQDAEAAGLGNGYFSKRIMAKNSTAYYNESWDLVDRCAQDSTIVISELEGLPEEYQGKSEEELQTIVKEKMAEREEIKRKIAELKVTSLRSGAKGERRFRREPVGRRHAAGD